MVAHEDETSLVTSGRGLIDGTECEVLRCWQLSDTSAGGTRSFHQSSCSA